MFGIRRREFISLLGGAAVTWPVAARAQQAAAPVIGMIRSGLSETEPGSRMIAFRQGLNESGYVEGQNVTIESRVPRYRLCQRLTECPNSNDLIFWARAARRCRDRRPSSAG